MIVAILKGFIDFLIEEKIVDWRVSETKKIELINKFLSKRAEDGKN